jgi:hypothetical protein
MLYLGLISTDAYYRAFGLRFQFLSYPWNLILFRGILTTIRFPYLWIVVAAIAALMHFDRIFCKQPELKLHKFRVPAFYVISGLLLWWATSTGTSLGEGEARADMHWKATTLPRIEKFVSMDRGNEDCHQCVLLMMNSSEAVYFEAVGEGETNVIPITKIRARSSFIYVEVSR